LYTHVADWDEFRDLQMAFLKASVPEAEVPTDVAIHGALHQAAAREGIGYIIMGHSFRTEGIAPIDWTYMDGRYIKGIRRQFGTRKQKTVPNFTISEFIYYSFIRRIKVVPILNYVRYRHTEVQQVLADETGWQYYGGHHHESSYTHFCQAALFVPKFNVDKRRLECSAKIRSGQTTREEALRELQEPYPVDPELVEYCTRKVGLTPEQWQEILATPPKNFRDYSTYYPLIRAFRPLLTLAYRMGLVSPILYYKFLD
ncbi:MAG: N-acetyl sugar amidotransferase, partial [Acidobacteria bacterium]|nr:N-acetyl sugar amidotransferase [Acidobacteriota bacterium]